MKTTNIRFCEKKKIFFGISIAILVIGVIFNIFFGTSLDIKFKGGAMLNYSFEGKIQQNDVLAVVEDITEKSAEVRVRDSAGLIAGSGSSVSISFAGTDALPLDQQKEIAATLNEKYPDAHFEIVETSSVDPSMGQSFFLKCICAIILTAVLLLIYIGWRFKKIGGMAAACMAIVALLHDVAIVYFTFVVFRISINDSFIAVVLTILGYSLNNTIIIYDRIRENRRIMGPKTDITVLVDASINQTLSRSIDTSFATFVVIACVFIVGSVFGLTSVTTFSLPLMVGIAGGCYSSVCIAGPLYVTWQQLKAKKAVAASKKAK